MRIKIQLDPPFYLGMIENTNNKHGLQKMKTALLLLAGLSALSFPVFADETAPAVTVAAPAATTAPPLDPKMQAIFDKAKAEVAVHHAHMEKRLNRKYANLPPDERAKKISEVLARYDEHLMHLYIKQATGQDDSFVHNLLGSAGVAALGIVAPRVMMDVAAAGAKSGVVGKISGAVVNRVPNNGFGNMGSAAISGMASKSQ